MKRVTLLLLPLGLILTLATSNHAQDGAAYADPRPPRDARSGRRPPPPPPPPPLLLLALDLDGDGELSASEIASAAESLKQLDQDGDGKLSRQELRPPPPPPPPDWFGEDAPPFPPPPGAPDFSDAPCDRDHRPPGMSPPPSAPQDGFAPENVQ